MSTTRTSRRLRRTRQKELAALEVVSSLAPDERAAFAGRHTVVSLPAGSRLCRQGKTGNELLFVLDGTARVERSGAHVSDVATGAVLGERSMLLMRAFQDADVVATSDMVVAAISRREFLDAVSEQPSIRASLAAVSAARS